MTSPFPSESKSVAPEPRPVNQFDGRRSSFADWHESKHVLRRGCARLLVIEPNHADARTMLDEELDAKGTRVGLWGACGDA